MGARQRQNLLILGKIRPRIARMARIGVWTLLRWSAHRPGRSKLGKMAGLEILQSAGVGWTLLRPGTVRTPGGVQRLSQYFKRLFHDCSP